MTDYDSDVSEAIAHLISNLDAQPLPLALLSQYMPMQYVSVREGRVSPRPRDLILDRIGNCVDDYIYAISGAIKAGVMDSVAF